MIGKWCSGNKPSWPWLSCGSQRGQCKVVIKLIWDIGVGSVPVQSWSNGMICKWCRVQGPTDAVYSLRSPNDGDNDVRNISSEWRCLLEYQKWRGLLAFLAWFVQGGHNTIIFGSEEALHLCEFQQWGMALTNRVWWWWKKLMACLKIGISDAGTPQPDRDLNVETLLVKL